MKFADESRLWGEPPSPQAKYTNAIVQGWDNERAARFCWKCKGNNTLLNIQNGAVVWCADCEPILPDDILERCGYPPA